MDKDNIENKTNAQYVNSVSVSHSSYEIRTEYYVESPQENEETLREKVADLRLSPQLAKVFLGILEQALISYEENIGKIPIIEDTKNE